MTSPQTLADKVAIVTGAGQGVGEGIARAFAKAGAAVVIAERNADTGAAVAESISASGGAATAIVCDVYRHEDLEAAVACALDTYGALDIVVNNAQDLRGLRKSLLDVTEEDMRRQFDSGVMSTLRMMQLAFPHLRDRGGRIINMGSAAGVIGMSEEGAYAAAKEGIRALTRVAAREWGQFGITVNVICPAAATPATAKVQIDLSSRPIQRLGDPEADIGAVAVFLASEASGYITGHTLMADGGARMDAGR